VATRFWRGTTSANWSDTNNWAATSGGATPATVPTSADTVTLDSAGNNPCTINGTTNNCLSFTLSTGYTSIVTNNCTSLTIAGNVSIATGATLTQTAGTWIINATCAFTSNGLTIPYPITLNAFTMTLTGGNLTLSGGFTSGGNCNLTSNTLNIAGSTLTVTNSIGGSSNIVFGTTGSPTWTGAGIISNANLTINTSGTLTISGTVNYQGTLTYTAGTVVTTGSTLTLPSTCTLNTAGISWNNVSITGNGATYTINSLLTVTGTLLFSTGSYTVTGSSTFTTAILTWMPNTVRTLSLKSTTTYTVTTQINLVPMFGSAATVQSITATSAALLNYSGARSGQNILYTSFTDINASGGNTLFDYVGGTLTRTTNIQLTNLGSYTPKTVAAVSAS